MQSPAVYFMAPTQLIGKESSVPTGHRVRGLEQTMTIHIAEDLALNPDPHSANNRDINNCTIGYNSPHHPPRELNLYLATEQTKTSFLFVQETARATKSLIRIQSYIQIGPCLCVHQNERTVAVKSQFPTPSNYSQRVINLRRRRQYSYRNEIRTDVSESDPRIRYQQQLILVDRKFEFPQLINRKQVFCWA